MNNNNLKLNTMKKSKYSAVYKRLAEIGVNYTLIKNKKITIFNENNLNKRIVIQVYYNESEEEHFLKAIDRRLEDIKAII